MEWRVTTYPEIYKTYSGQTIHIRLIRPEDTSLLIEMFDRLSPESKRLRFHLYTSRIPEEIIRREAMALSESDPERRLALVALIEAKPGQHAVGVAQLVRASATATEAEVAIVIRDDFQRKGLGRHLLRLLARQARTLGITHFTAWVMAHNLRLMKLIHSMEEVKQMESESRRGETKIRVPI